MGLLDSFEKGLERAVNSAFAKTFRSGIQPVEIASALRSELDKKAAIVSRDRILAPNTFTVHLSRDRRREHAHARRRARRRARHPRAEARQVAGLHLRRTGLDHPPARRPAVHRHAPRRVVDRRGPGRVARSGRRRGQAASDRRSRAPSSGAAATPTSRSPTPARAASTSRSCGTASAPWCATCSSTNGTAPGRPQGRRGRAAARLDRDASAAPTSSSASSRRRRRRVRRRPADDATRAFDVRDGGRCRERTDPPAAAHRIPRAAVVLRLRGRLLAARRPLRRQGATDAGAGGRRRRAPAPRASATAPVAPSRRPRPPAAQGRPGDDRRGRRASSSRAGRRRASSCRSAPSRSRSAARASRAS